MLCSQKVLGIHSWILQSNNIQVTLFEKTNNEVIALKWETLWTKFSLQKTTLWFSINLFFSYENTVYSYNECLCRITCSQKFLHSSFFPCFRSFLILSLIPQNPRETKACLRHWIEFQTFNTYKIYFTTMNVNLRRSIY